MVSSRSSLRHFLDVANEANSFAKKSFYQSLFTTVVIDGQTHCVNSSSQCGFRDNAALPDCGNQVVFRDHPVSITDQIFQNVEDLRLQQDELGPATKLSPPCINTVVFEVVEQSKAPQVTQV